MVRQVESRLGMARFGVAGKLWQVGARIGQERQVEAGKVGCGKFWRGKLWLGRARSVLAGMARLGVVR